MRKLFLFALPALLLFAAGCKDKNEPSSKTLSVWFGMPTKRTNNQLLNL